MHIHDKSVDMNMDMDGKFHINGKPGGPTSRACIRDAVCHL